jgi:hypothetical protein
MNYEEQERFEGKMVLFHAVRLHQDDEQIREWERFVKAFDADPRRSKKYLENIQ